MQVCGICPTVYALALPSSAAKPNKDQRGFLIKKRNIRRILIDITLYYTYLRNNTSCKMKLNQYNGYECRDTCLSRKRKQNRSLTFLQSYLKEHTPSPNVEDE
ncbi:hypothetical protein J6590_059831 [Homalodisca vitripennis]|nr:hypothetical protein J6590_059831 [Homalodisca vitripennis]